jgi:hypothetical protein
MHSTTIIDQSTTTHIKKPTACAECRRVHKKCDKQRPCSRCVSTCLDCVDVCPGKRGRPRKVSHEETHQQHHQHIPQSQSNHQHLFKYQSCLLLGPVASPTSPDKASQSHTTSNTLSFNGIKKKKLVFHSEYNYGTKKFKSSETLETKVESIRVMRQPEPITIQQQQNQIRQQRLHTIQPIQITTKPVYHQITPLQVKTQTGCMHTHITPLQVVKQFTSFEQPQLQMTVSTKRESRSSPLWDNGSQSVQPVTSPSSLPSLRSLGLLPASPTNSSPVGFN